MPNDKEQKFKENDKKLLKWTCKKGDFYPFREFFAIFSRNLLLFIRTLFNLFHWELLSSNLRQFFILLELSKIQIFLQRRNFPWNHFKVLQKFCRLFFFFQGTSWHTSKCVVFKRWHLRVWNMFYLVLDLLKRNTRYFLGMLRSLLWNLKIIFFNNRNRRIKSIF